MNLWDAQTVPQQYYYSIDPFLVAFFVKIILEGLVRPLAFNANAASCSSAPECDTVNLNSPPAVLTSGKLLSK